MPVTQWPPFSVTDSNDLRKRFLELIKKLREKFRNPDRPFVFNDVARLPPQEDHPTRWLDLELRDGERNAITLRIRVDNFFAVGFRNRAGTWFEFSPDRTGEMPRSPYITGSTDLRFSGSYLTNDALDGVRLGMWSVRTAVTSLANYNNRNDLIGRGLPNLLFTIIVNFCESVRFDAIATTVADQASDSAIALTADQRVMIRAWGKLSGALLRSANDPEDPGGNPTHFRNLGLTGIHNAYEARQAVGMVLIPSDMFCSGGRGRRSADEAGQCPTGCILVDVISVVIRDMGGKNSGSIYGTANIADAFGSQVLFNRNWRSIVPVSRGMSLPLTGLRRAVLGYDDFVISLDLRDADTVQDTLPDDVARGEVVWNDREVGNREHDVVQEVTVTGLSGHAVVAYAVMSNAVVADLKIMLVRSINNNSAEADIYGTITATTKVGIHQVTVTIFESTRRDGTRIRVGSLLPLQRTVLAVPLGSFGLSVQADLWFTDTIPDSSPDSHVALGSAGFSARTGGQSQPIAGPDGQVQIQVDWSTQI